MSFLRRSVGRNVCDGRTRVANLRFVYFFYKMLPCVYIIYWFFFGVVATSNTSYTTHYLFEINLKRLLTVHWGLIEIVN